MNAQIDISTTILKTERLILRPWKQTDLDDLFAYACVDGVGQMAGWLPHETKETSQMILDMFIEGKQTFALEYQGKVIGSIGIEKYIETELPECQHLQGRAIGYVLSKEYWGQGLMPEAVQKVIAYLFSEKSAVRESAGKMWIFLCKRGRAYDKVWNTGSNQFEYPVGKGVLHKKINGRLFAPRCGIKKHQYDESRVGAFDLVFFSISGAAGSPNSPVKSGSRQQHLHFCGAAWLFCLPDAEFGVLPRLCGARPTEQRVHQFVQ